MKQLVVWAVFGMLLGFGVSKAQPILGFTNGAGFPQVVNAGQAVPLSGWIKNSGNTSFTGLLDIEFKADSGNVHSIDNNFSVVNLLPGDSVLWSKSNYNFPPGHLRQNNNDVLIWPTSSVTSEEDTISIHIYYTDGAALRLSPTGFQGLQGGFDPYKEYDFTLEAENMSKVPSSNMICLYAKLPTTEAVCIEQFIGNVDFGSFATFHLHEFGIWKSFDLRLLDSLQQNPAEILFFAIETTVSIEPYNVVTLPVEAVVAVAPPTVGAEVSVFPNPFNDVLNITVPAAWMADAQVRLTDLAGRLVAQQTLETGAVDLGSLASGSYLLEVVSRKGVHRQQVICR